MKVAFSISTLLTVAIACGGRARTAREDDARTCADRVDNDGDGFVDCDDQDCIDVCADAGSDADTDADADSDSDTRTTTDSDTGTETNTYTGSGSDTGPEPCPDGIDWLVETVHSSDDTGAQASIAVDDTGAAHISFFDVTWNRIRYATNASGDWVVETAADNPLTGFSSLAVDADGYAHILYTAWGAAAELGYAENTSGDWVGDTVDAAPWYGYFPDIVIDDDGVLHVSYVSSPSSGTAQLRYATYDGAAWDLDDVANISCACGTGIALDDAGVVGILLGGRCCSGVTRVYYNDGADWTDADLPATGQYGSVLFASDDQWHALYWVPDQELEYAFDDGSGWDGTSLPLDPNSVGSLVEDPDGVLHFAYATQEICGAPREVRWVSLVDGEWVSEVASDYGTSVANTIDRWGLGHVAWYDYGESDLLYARQCP